MKIIMGESYKNKSTEEIVKVFKYFNKYEPNVGCWVDYVYYHDETSCSIHVMTEEDFIENFQEIYVFEYKISILVNNSQKFESNEFYTTDEVYSMFGTNYTILSETKRKRKHVKN